MGNPSARIRMNYSLLFAASVLAAVALAAPPSVQAQNNDPSEHLPYGVPIPPGQGITRPPEPYAPSQHGRPLTNTQPDANVAGRPDVQLPVRDHRARVPDRISPTAEPGPGDSFPTELPGSGDRGLWIYPGSSGVYAINDAQTNLSIPASAIGTTIYAPTHMSAGNACMETVTAHWYFSGMSGTAHAHGFWDWCMTDGSGAWQVFEFMDATWQQKYVRSFGGEPRYATQVYELSPGCWIGMLYNFTLGQWEEKTTICGTGQSGFGNIGWTMWESHYLMDQAQVCPAFPDVRASEVRVWRGDRWTHLTPPESGALGPYGMCWNNGTYEFSNAQDFDYWQASTSGFDPSRVNVGGNQYVDHSGNVWERDRGCSGGWTQSTSSSIEGTEDAPLYQNWKTAVSFCSYNVPNGRYAVTLKFIEPTHTSVGKRVFDVKIENQTVLDGFDPFAQASGRNRAVDRTFNVDVADGAISIAFTKRLDNPVLAAVEIGPPDTDPPTVEARAPIPESAGVSVGTNVTSTFSEAMLQDSLTGETAFLVKAGDSSPVPATVTYDALTRTATVNPNQSLAGDTFYTMTVKGGANGVKDLAGVPLLADVTWRFRTGSAAAGPTHDDFAAAETVNVPLNPATLSRSAATGPATMESGEPQPPCLSNATVGKTVWYRLVPQAAGTLNVTSVGSDFDTVLAVYSGNTLASLTVEACNDDPSFGGNRAFVSVGVRAGQAYFMQAGGHNGAAGNLALLMEISGPALPGVTDPPAPTSVNAANYTILSLIHI